MPDTRATLVLVHGAWHGPWCWERMLPHLTSHFALVQALQLPSATSSTAAGLSADAQHLNAILAGVSGPVVLCGHSYGGMVISAADTTRCDIRHLVYVCAYVTQPGESLEASLRAGGERRPGHWIRRAADGRCRVDAHRAAALFYGDCDSETQSWAISKLRPHWTQALSDEGGTPAWTRLPSTYVACTKDRALSPRLQSEYYAPRTGQVVTLMSGHSPFVSVPQQLAQVLVSAAQ